MSSNHLDIANRNNTNMTAPRTTNLGVFIAFPQRILLTTSSLTCIKKIVKEQEELSGISGRFA